MQHNNYEWFITQIVESMLPRFSDEKVCLGMKIDMHWSHHSEDPKKFRKEVVLIFYRPNNYTKVFLKNITNERAFHIKNNIFYIDEIADHDSCWRDLSFIFKTFAEAWRYFDQFDIEGRDIDPSFHFSIFGGSPTYYKINEMKKSDSEDHDREYIIDMGDAIPMSEISPYMPSQEV